MRIAHRLYLTVAPAVVGVLVVAALAYWGQYERRVPTLVLLVAAGAVLGTMVLGWLNARHVARRVERLARSDAATSDPATVRMTASAVGSGYADDEIDELARIESVVDRLNTAVAVAESSKADRIREATELVRDHATLLATVAGCVASRLEEVRLPLHILLDNHFGELNENQEEMLGSARAAADAADADVVALQRLADLDRGARTLRRDRILPGDLLKALVPTLQAQAEKQGMTLNVDIEPLLPVTWGDQPQLQEALATLLGEAIAGSKQRELELHLEKHSAGSQISISTSGAMTPTVHTALATHLVEMMGGRVERSSSALRIEL